MPSSCYIKVCQVFSKYLPEEAGRPPFFFYAHVFCHVNNSPFCSGADIRSVCTEAGMYAIRARRKTVTEKDFLDAVNKVIKGYQKFSATPKYMVYNWVITLLLLFLKRSFLLAGDKLGRLLISLWSCTSHICTGHLWFVSFFSANVALGKFFVQIVTMVMLCCENQLV